VFGGYSDELQADQDTVLKYDTETNEWSTRAPMPDVYSGHGDNEFIACVIDGLVYFVGAGVSGCDVLRFDPVSGVWSTLAPMLNNRWAGGRLYATGGCLYVAGGQQSSTERYDAASDTWCFVANMLEGRRAFKAVTIESSAGPAKEQDLFDSLIAKAARQEL
jgi:hypothetical protein